jgi:hypothetical protein
LSTDESDAAPAETTPPSADSVAVASAPDAEPKGDIPHADTLAAAQP